MSKIHAHIESVQAFAPATCANVAVGFDLLGFALQNVGDWVTLTKRKDDNILIEEISSESKLPLAILENTASLVVKKVCTVLELGIGFNIKIKKGIPVSSGMGGSAASAVAALVALNAFLIHPLSLPELARYALYGEEVACGSPHADNIVPSLFGGLTLIQSALPLKVIALPIPKIYYAFIHPHLQISTEEARRILKNDLPIQDVIQQSAYLATFMVAVFREDLHLMQSALKDILIEPQRAHFIPGFYAAKELALSSGALGFSLSGSGPAMFAFASERATAEKIVSKLTDFFLSKKIELDSWVDEIGAQGAYIMNIEGKPHAVC